MSMTNVTAGGNGGGLKNQSLANLSQRQASFTNQQLASGRSGVASPSRNSSHTRRQRSQNKERIQALKQRLVVSQQASDYQQQQQHLNGQEASGNNGNQQYEMQMDELRS